MPDSQEHWKDKYLDAIDRFEREEARWNRMDTTLRRAVGRLSIACRGLDNRLDEELTELTQAIRQKVDIDVLDRRIDALSEAIVALDEAPAAPAFNPPPELKSLASSAPAAPPPAPGDHGADLLKRMLGQLRLEPPLAGQVEALGERLLGLTDKDALGGVADALADLINRQQQQLARERLGMESLLAQVDSRLDEFATYLLQDRDARVDERESRSELSTRISSEVDSLGRQTRQATELEQLKAQVSTRLTAIDTHVQDYRSREEQRIAKLEERGDAMRQRIDELERETSQLRQSLQAEQQMAATDPLTRIPNRLAYQQAVVDEISRFRRFERPLALAVWDIDAFKAINDTYGHKAGDKVLFAVAQVLRKHLRSTDFVARVGGEEFVSLLPGAELAQAQRLCEELRRKISAIGFHFGGKPVKVTTSVGLTALRPEDDADSVFERADQALYQAKRNGRDRCEVG
ncbi:GGDEF domain-containing protein [Aquimonas voraii]|uniref:diguanylate cyclase n=1 Tax=Aquimonas voraii TaxID=265719 RepID=A0A1G6XMK5_9GAMM|nr:GGDEF domain-containing protein [Aquimonas voraii]SDD79211.1 diguanylate cyclase [Aquimonas voraii]